MIRKLLAVILCALLAVFAVGCSGTDRPESNQPDGNELRDGEDGSGEPGDGENKGQGKVELTLAYEIHDDEEGYAKLDITVPVFDSDEPWAQSLNETILADFDQYREMDLEYVAENTGGFTYPWLRIEHELVEINGAYALYIMSTVTSGYGAGDMTSNSSYYYDSTEDKIITQEDFLAKAGYTKRDIEEAFMEGPAEALGVTSLDFEQLKQIFYIDNNGEIVFHPL